MHETHYALGVDEPAEVQDGGMQAAAIVDKVGGEAVYGLTPECLGTIL